MEFCANLFARALGFSPSTISREIKRHTPIDFKGLYCALRHMKCNTTLH
ncbi:helix-turn-helix domain-containing protein [Piscirickettsia salmonis]|nr:helix-turn-helix domain-containing protein [Piscirickettsia salmonis]